MVATALLIPHKEIALNVLDIIDNQRETIVYANHIFVVYILKDLHAIYMNQIILEDF